VLRKVYDETDIVWSKIPKAKNALLVSTRDVSPLPAIIAYGIIQHKDTTPCGHIVSKLLYENAPFQSMNENFVFPGIPIFQQGDWVIILMDSLYPDDPRNANQWLFTYPVCRAMVEALSDISVENLFCLTTTPPHINGKNEICEPFTIDSEVLSDIEENGVVLPIELWLPLSLFPRFFSDKKSFVTGCNSRDYDIVSAERMDILIEIVKGAGLSLDENETEKKRVLFKREGKEEMRRITETLKNRLDSAKESEEVMFQ